MKTNFNDIYLEKIKINIENNNFWVVPSTFKIFTPKRSNFIIKKANSIEQIIKENNLQVGNYYFSFNRDPKFTYFNQLQKLSFLSNLEINSNVLKEIEKNDIYFFDINEKIKIKFDQKNLYKIYRGNAFYINEDYFDKYVNYLKTNNSKKEVWIFRWNGRKFELTN